MIIFKLFCYLILPSSNLRCILCLMDGIKRWWSFWPLFDHLTTFWSLVHFLIIWPLFNHLGNVLVEGQHSPPGDASWLQFRWAKFQDSTSKHFFLAKTGPKWAACQIFIIISLHWICLFSRKTFHGRYIKASKEKSENFMDFHGQLLLHLLPEHFDLHRSVNLILV